jgi:hypothetical protein
MYVTHESRDLLVIHSPASTSRMVYTVLMGIGGVLLCLGGLGLAAGLVLLTCGQPFADYLNGGGFAGILGVLLAGGGWLGYRAAQDTDFHFDGKAECLTVRRRSGERTIPFSRIRRAEVFDAGDDCVAYALRLSLRDPAEELTMNDRLHRDAAVFQPLAERINRFLKRFRPEEVNINLAQADLLTMAKGILSNLWHGVPEVPPAAAPAPAPVVRDGLVLFVCPECGFETDDPGTQPPYPCTRCSRPEAAVYLQDRTPGRTVLVACGCGASFSVPLSFAGTKRRCPRCGQKCAVGEGSPAPPPNQGRARPLDTSFREEGG